MDGPKDLHLNLISPHGTGLTEHAQINEVGCTCKKWCCFSEAMEILLILHAAYICPYLSRKALAVFQCHLQNHWSLPVPAVCFHRSNTDIFSFFSDYHVLGWWKTRHGAIQVAGSSLLTCASGKIREESGQTWLSRDWVDSCFDKSYFDKSHSSCF